MYSVTSQEGKQGLNIAESPLGQEEAGLSLALQLPDTQRWLQVPQEGRNLPSLPASQVAKLGLPKINRAEMVPPPLPHTYTHEPVLAGGIPPAS